MEAIPEIQDENKILDKFMNAFKAKIKSKLWESDIDEMLEYPLIINIHMDREDLLHYERNDFSSFEDNAFSKRKNGIQMPSFGTIEE